MLLPGDGPIGRAIQRTPGGPSLDVLADDVYVLRIAAFALGAVMAVRARSYALAAAAILVLLFLGLNPVLKDILDRARPTAADLVVRDPVPGSGFPSGHAMSSALLFGYCAVVVLRCAQPLGAAVALALATLAAALVGWDRVWDGAHWPSDVVGGWSFGLALLVVADWLPRRAGELLRR